MFTQRPALRVLRTLVAVVCLAGPVYAQTAEDGVVLRRGELLTGNLYSYDQWDEYWEGALKRSNGNIGEISTKTNIWYAAYGVGDRLNVLVTVPYVWTGASQGVLHGSQGFQDITVSGKFTAFQHAGSAGTLRAIGVVSVGGPLSEYGIELVPLSIGMGSKSVSWRGTMNYHARSGWFLNGSNTYTWRSQVRLDRPYFFTDDEFVVSDQVDMPNVWQFGGGVGYMGRRLMTEVNVSQQRTLGGGDIRRQDMPFLSNRMNATRVGAMVMHPIPAVGFLEGYFGIGRTLSGRNVGQSTTVTGGLLYRFHGGATR
jgi:hypothetical protein